MKTFTIIEKLSDRDMIKLQSGYKTAQEAADDMINFPKTTKYGRVTFIEEEVLTEKEKETNIILSIITEYGLKF
jgi:hypothetical protein